MKRSLAILLLLLATSVQARTDCVQLAKVGATGAASEKDGAASRVPYPQIDTRQVVEVFLKAVDAGQLEIFGKPASRSQLKPERVEYVYTLEHQVPTVSVYAALRKPVPFPDMPDMLAQGVTATLDREGRITESTVHCH